MPAFEPNVFLPLAASYNTRGITGYTNAVTNGLDQRKVNLVYRPVKNSMTGKTTLYLCKRPGVILDTDNASFGTTGQIAYLVSFGAALGGQASSNMWVYSTSGDDVRASSSAATTVIVTAANYVPMYVDDTSIGGNDTVVLQLGLSGTGVTTQTVWFSSAIATWTQITDADFPDVTGKMELMDGYAFAMLDSANTQRIYNSDLNSLANWTSTNFITKQIQQDKAVGLMRLGNLIIGGGQETMEVYRNAGNASGSPLESIPQLAQRVGIQPREAPYYCTLGNKLYFYGRFGGNRGSTICMFDGSRVERVSNLSVEAIISQQGSSGIYTVTFQGREAIAVSLTVTSAATQQALLFFPDYNEWFEWTSTKFCPATAGGWFLGTGANQHKLYKFVETDTWQDVSTDYDATMQFTVPKKGNNRAFMPGMGLTADTARSAATIVVSKSDDDGQNWDALGTIDLTSADKTLPFCGSWEGRRQIRLVNSGNLEGRMETFFARID